MNILELYQYHLFGYSNDPVKKQFFNNFSLTERGQCGQIKVKNDPLVKDIPEPGVCDPLNSQQGGNNYLQLLQNAYISYPTKNSETVVDKGLINYYKKEIENGFFEKVECNIEVEMDFTKSNLEVLLNDTQSYIYTINVQQTDKIIIFGDLHGSFHTFLRTIYRLGRFGVIDLNTLEVSDGYKIIFLGDVVDRGKWGFDICFFIFNLIIINGFDKVIFNRGNHEDFIVTSSYGFDNEVKKKFVDGSDNKVLNKILNIFKIMPSAVIIRSPTGNFWLSHGGIPNHEFNIKNEKVVFINQADSYQIRWNDFSFNINTIQSVRGQGIYNIGRNDVQKFLEQNKITYIIRAHQDTISNAFLFTSLDTDEHRLLFDKTLEDFRNSPYDSTKEENFKPGLYINKNDPLHGPLAKLDLNKESYKVITLSTNTDYGRNLINDSFGVLRFDQNPDIFPKEPDFIAQDQLIFAKENNTFDLRNELKDIIVPSAAPSAAPSAIPIAPPSSTTPTQPSIFVKDFTTPSVTPSLEVKKVYTTTSTSAFGGYYEGYLKYKSKYLELKKKFMEQT